MRNIWDDIIFNCSPLSQAVDESMQAVDLDVMKIMRLHIQNTMIYFVALNY